MIPILKVLLKEFDSAIFSVDTFRAEIAKASLDLGAAIINDITAGKFDDKMLPLISKYNSVYIVMHMKGLPNCMQDNPEYNDITAEILNFFNEKIKILNENNINKIIIDPGFGFGKKLNDNFKILKNLELFKELNVPVLVGLSRKSMIYKSLNIDSTDALNGTSILNSVALLKNAKF